MDIFSQNKLLIRLIVVLVIINLMSIGLVIYKSGSRPPRHFPPPMMSEEAQDELASVLTHELHLSKEQAESLKNLRYKYFRMEHALQEKLRSQRDSMNNEMFNMQTDTMHVKEIAKRIATNENEMELLRLRQAIELKQICTPDQLQRFEELVIEIKDYLKPKHPPRH